MEEKNSLTILSALKWTAAYFGVMLFYTLLDVAVWRKIMPAGSEWLNTVSIALCMAGYLYLLGKNGLRLRVWENSSVSGILSALVCALMFFVLLDHGLDPVLERFFPSSELDYQKMTQGILRSPAAGFVQVCILAPFMEEILMRGYLLEGLKNRYGAAAALLVTAAAFAALHLNLVQSLSALVCGLVLGLLYLKTESILCCIVAHSVYNAISWIVIAVPGLAGARQ